MPDRVPIDRGAPASPIPPHGEPVAGRRDEAEELAWLAAEAARRAGSVGLLRELVEMWAADRAAMRHGSDQTLEQFIQRSASFSERYWDLKARIEAFVESHDGS